MNEDKTQMNNGKIFDWESIETRHPHNPKIGEKVVDGDNMQLVWAEFHPGTQYRLHSHEREQFSFMVSGRLKLTVGNETREIGPGEMWHAPSNVMHGGEPIGNEKVVFIDVYSPPAEDMRRDIS